MPNIKKQVQNVTKEKAGAVTVADTAFIVLRL
jgi:hypothetical protein